MGAATLNKSNNARRKESLEVLLSNLASGDVPKSKSRRQRDHGQKIGTRKAGPKRGGPGGKEGRLVRILGDFPSRCNANAHAYEYPSRSLPRGGYRAQQPKGSAARNITGTIGAPSTGQLPGDQDQVRIPSDHQRTSSTRPLILQTNLLFDDPIEKVTSIPYNLGPCTDSPKVWGAGKTTPPAPTPWLQGNAANNSFGLSDVHVVCSYYTAVKHCSWILTIDTLWL